MEDNALNIDGWASLKSGVSRLTLVNFRNYPYLRFDAQIAPVIIYGENGVGKTNILEAISFLTPGRGLRSAKLADLERISPAVVPQEYNAEEIAAVNWAVSAKIVKNNESFELGTAVEKSARKADESLGADRRIVRIDGQKTSSQGELGKYLSALWLTPQMERLFKGGSQPRRAFLDRLVYAFDLEHAKRTANFEHLYKEWYQLLKTGSNDNFWLFSLEDKMAALGVAIAAARREQVARLNTFIQKEPDDVFPSVRLELDGIIEQMLDKSPAIEVEDFYRTLLFRQRRNILFDDKIEGVNRTDFKVFYSKKNMPAEMCSTGEQKSLLISIILAQTKSQTLYQGFAPILLLDEVAAHLDNIKKDALLEKITGLNLQAFITAVNKDIFAPIARFSQFMEVKNQGISQQ